MRKALILILLFYSSFFSSGQTPTENEEKYWYYRFRMINDFMLVGDCDGCSIVPAFRDFIDVQNNVHTHILKYSDGIIHTSYYAGALALEYYLLKLNGQKTDETERELYYVLEAFNRLDKNAEELWGQNPGSLNGFLVRDDVKSGFLSPTNVYNDDDLGDINVYKHFNQGLALNTEIHLIESDWTEQQSVLAEESLDQIVHLLSALALVSKYVDPLDNYNLKAFSDGETNFVQEAKNITDRVINYISQNNWVIKNPVTGLNVFRGDMAWFWSYGFAEAAGQVLNPSSQASALITTNPFITNSPYNDALTLLDYPIYQLQGGTLSGAALTATTLVLNNLIYILWLGLNATNIINKPAQTEAIAIDEMYKFYKLTSVCNCIYTFAGIGAVNETPLALKNGVDGLSATVPLYDYQYVTLLRQVLHGGSNLNNGNIYEDLLNSAPCQGPYNYGNGDFANFEWSSTDRLLYPERRGQGLPGYNTTWFADYPGFGYLLLHNLYYKIQNDLGTGGYQVMTNAMYRDVSVDFPLSTIVGNLGSNNIPVTIEGFSSITAENTINFNPITPNSGNVSYRAGQKVRLIPGFHAESGTYFRAYIDPLHCDETGDYKASDPQVQEVLSKTPLYYDDNIRTTYLEHMREVQQSNTSLALKNTVAETSIETEHLVYPNPTNGILYYSLPANQTTNAAFTISIQNSLGQTVQSTEGSVANTGSIDVSNLPTGHYVFKIISESNIYTKTFIKE
ncbi:MAG: T9SS type A sorting domain-containing protein [Flavobacteriales bacterium]